MAIGEGRPDVLQGTLDLTVLKTLAVTGPQRGYGIARAEDWERIAAVMARVLRLSADR